MQINCLAEEGEFTLDSEILFVHYQPNTRVFFFLVQFSSWKPRPILLTTENIFTNLLYTTTEELFAKKLCTSPGSLYVLSGRALEDLSEAELFLSQHTPELEHRQDIWSCWNYLKTVFLLYLEIPLCCTYSHHSKYSFPRAVHYPQPFSLQNQTRLPSINASFQPKTFRPFPVQTNDKYMWLKDVFNNAWIVTSLMEIRLLHSFPPIPGIAPETAGDWQEPWRTSNRKKVGQTTKN